MNFNMKRCKLRDQMELVIAEANRDATPESQENYAMSENVTLLTVWNVFELRFSGQRRKRVTRWR